MTSSTNKKHSVSFNAWSVTLCFLLAVIAIALPDFAMAQLASSNVNTTSNDLAKIACRVVTLLQGNIARGVAAFGVIFLGFSLFLGKISWGTALALALGLGAIFGAQTLVEMMSGGTFDCANVVNAT